MGVKFLKHIERTKILVHCLSADSADPLADYQTVRHELETYSTKLAQKEEILILTKSDLLETSAIKKLQQKLKIKLPVSIADPGSLKSLNDLITKLLG